MCMEGKVSILNVLKFAGAFIAFIIGSGFATGQEIMQFFTSNGLYSLGSIVISLILVMRKNLINILKSMLLNKVSLEILQKMNIMSFHAEDILRDYLDV